MQRDELTREILEEFEARDDVGKWLFKLAVHAVQRGDGAGARRFFKIDAMPRRGGRTCDLDALEGFGGVGSTVKGEELRTWAGAVSAILDLGDPDLLDALDGLARRRAAH